MATFCRYGYGANASETVEKIATDQRNITNPSCVLSFAACQSISSITVKKAGC